MVSKEFKELVEKAYNQALETERDAAKYREYFEAESFDAVISKVVEAKNSLLRIKTLISDDIDKPKVEGPLES